LGTRSGRRSVRPGRPLDRTLRGFYLYLLVRLAIAARCAGPLIFLASIAEGIMLWGIWEGHRIRHAKRTGFAIVSNGIWIGASPLAALPLRIAAHRRLERQNNEQGADLRRVAALEETINDAIDSWTTIEQVLSRLDAPIRPPGAQRRQMGSLIAIPVTAAITMHSPSSPLTPSTISRITYSVGRDSPQRGVGSPAGRGRG
jgi:hypothetical protein